MSIISRINPNRSVETNLSVVNEMLCLDEDLLGAIKIGEKKRVNLGFGKAEIYQCDDLSMGQDFFDAAISYRGNNIITHEDVYRGALELERTSEQNYHISVSKISVDKHGNDSIIDTEENRFTFDIALNEDENVVISHIHDSQSIVGFHELFSVFEESVHDFVAGCLRNQDRERLEQGIEYAEAHPFKLIKK